MLKGEDRLTKRQYVYTTDTSTVTATFTTTTASSIAATCNVKSIQMKISQEAYEDTGYQKNISTME